MGSWFSSNRILSRVSRGSYEVGCVDLMVAEHPAGDPGVFVRIYYPTNEKATPTSPRPIWPSRVEYTYGLGEYLNLSQQKIGFLSSWIVGEKKEDCLSNAALATKAALNDETRKEKFPVLVFSHGLGGCRHYYSVYCTSMASHGYVVAAVEHRDMSACWTYDLIEDNDALTEKPIKMRSISRGEKEFKIRNYQVNKRVSECVKVFNVLEELNMSGNIPAKILVGEEFDWGQFKNCLDVSRTFIGGHSFGGATALGCTAYTTDFQAAIVLDGWTFSLDAAQQEQSRQPTLFMNIGSWQWEENLSVIGKISKQNVGNALFTLKGAAHQSFSDFPFLFNSYVARKAGVQGDTEARRCMEAAVEMSKAFLENGKEGAKTTSQEYSDFLTEELYGRETLKT
ncbi:unnamed protein product [Caenorhabditis auriculariae]|uniref:1-alkyl-2-acetylglycerophosphocholine esterase n=1 Tax=Caenorhabditis auriculariae TaxID=2777116 RepID=A0A8S1GW40_9PELO|nr:unnamed protein product [Caenorhabditis auriculariae]